MESQLNRYYQKYKNYKHKYIKSVVLGSRINTNKRNRYKEKYKQYKRTYLQLENSYHFGGCDPREESDTIIGVYQRLEPNTGTKLVIGLIQIALSISEDHKNLLGLNELLVYRGSGQFDYYLGQSGNQHPHFHQSNRDTNAHFMYSNGLPDDRNTANRRDTQISSKITPSQITRIKNNIMGVGNDWTAISNQSLNNQTKLKLYLVLFLIMILDIDEVKDIINTKYAEIVEPTSKQVLRYIIENPTSFLEDSLFNNYGAIGYESLTTDLTNVIKTVFIIYCTPNAATRAKHNTELRKLLAHILNRTDRAVGRSIDKQLNNDLTNIKTNTDIYDKVNKIIDRGYNRRTLRSYKRNCNFDTINGLISNTVIVPAGKFSDDDVDKSANYKDKTLNTPKIYCMNRGFKDCDANNHCNNLMINNDDQLLKTKNKQNFISFIENEANINFNKYKEQNPSDENNEIMLKVINIKCLVDAFEKYKYKTLLSLSTEYHILNGELTKLIEKEGNRDFNKYIRENDPDENNKINIIEINIKCLVDAFKKYKIQLNLSTKYDSLNLELVKLIQLRNKLLADLVDKINTHIRENPLPTQIKKNKKTSDLFKNDNAEIEKLKDTTLRELYQNKIIVDFNDLPNSISSQIAAPINNLNDRKNKNDEVIADIHKVITSSKTKPRTRKEKSDANLVVGFA